MKILVEEKCNKLDSDQIEGADFEFSGLGARFLENSNIKIWNLILKI